MKKSIIKATIIAALLLFAMPMESTAQTNTDSYIDINTTVEREVTPNELYLQITVREKDYKGKKTLEEMQEALIGALKINRIDIPECLTINYMGSEIGYKSFSKSIKSQTEAIYVLKLSDVATMQNVITALEERQISDIELEKVKFSKVKELKQEMAIEAMQQAQAEAKVLAGAIGQEIGKAITISTWTDCDEPQTKVMRNSIRGISSYSIESTLASPAMNISKSTYTFRANVRFELK